MKLNHRISIGILGTFVIAAICFVFALALIFITPGIPDEIIPFFISVASGSTSVYKFVVERTKKNEEDNEALVQDDPA